MRAMYMAPTRIEPAVTCTACLTCLPACCLRASRDDCDPLRRGLCSLVAGSAALPRLRVAAHDDERLLFMQVPLHSRAQHCVIEGVRHVPLAGTTAAARRPVDHLKLGSNSIPLVAHQDGLGCTRGHPCRRDQFACSRFEVALR